MVDSTSVSGKRGHAVAVTLLVVAVLAVSANSFVAPFLFDDDPSIALNPTIRHLSDLAQLLNPPSTAGATIQGRPLLNLSFALSYALSGYRVWGYHALSILIHIGAALALFGIVRRTLASPPLEQRFGKDSLTLAFLISLIWAVHPLQTESVTYIVQRAESQAGLFYLLTLFCFIRACEKPQGVRWFASSVFFCACGMGSKETMVSAPMAVLVYDSLFVSGGLPNALKRRTVYYGSLFSTLIILVALIAETGGNRGGTIGFGIDVPWWKYAAVQFGAITHYLRLSVWPSNLTFDYGVRWAKSMAEVIPYAIFVLALAAVSLFAFVRRSAWSFAAFIFFAVLAPSSSVIPGNRQTMAEHRMYIPLAGVLVLAVCITYRLLGRRAFPLLGVVAIVFGLLTIQRNVDYRSVIALYQDTAEKAPWNRFAQNNYGDALMRAGRAAESVPYFEAAVRLDRGYTDAMHNLGSAKMEIGQTDEAISTFKTLLATDPHYAEAENNLGNAYLKEGRSAEAVVQFEKAAHDKPEFAEAHYNLANSYMGEHRNKEAIAEYALAVKLNPESGQINNNYGIALALSGRFSEAIPFLTKAIELKPTDPGAQLNLANALASQGLLKEALVHYHQALALKPDYEAARHFLTITEDELKAKSGQ